MRRSDYAHRKTVKNGAVVREVDRRRHRELWRSVWVGALLVLLLLFSAWQHFELLRHGYRLEPVRQELDDEVEIGRHLRTEIETLSSPQRIERLAVERLQLVVPGPGDTIFIERAIAPELPDQTIVASR